MTTQKEEPYLLYSQQDEQSVEQMFYVLSVMTTRNDDGYLTYSVQAVCNFCLQIALQSRLEFSIDCAVGAISRKHAPTIRTCSTMGKLPTITLL